MSQRLEGHPLALRVFAAALARQAKSDPTRLLEVPFAAGDLREDDPLEIKVRELFTFYEQQLPPASRGLLGTVALFPAEADLTAIADLARKLPGVGDQLVGVSDGALRSALAALVMDGLLTRERAPGGEERYACHPVVRTHFRSVLLGRDARVATTAVGMLARWSHDWVETRQQLAPVTNAIALLLEANHVGQADALYRERLAGGHVFNSLAAAREGVQCVLGFLTPERRQLLVDHLSDRRLGSYAGDAGMFALQCAEFGLAGRYLREALEIYARVRDDDERIYALWNLTILLVFQGRLADAETAINDSVTLARSTRNDEYVGALATAAWVLALQGSMTLAAATIRQIEQVDRGSGTRGGIWGLQAALWAQLLLRLGRLAEAHDAIKRIMEVHTPPGWYRERAISRMLLGRLATLSNRHQEAADHLNAAATTFRAGYMLLLLPDVLLAQVDLDRRQRAWHQAASRLTEALRLASSRGMRLRHADALVLRGRIALDHQASPLSTAEALDDAGHALTIARQCGYAWAERDALQLTADALAAAGDPDSAHAARREAEAMTRRLIPTDLDLNWLR